MVRIEDVARVAPKHHISAVKRPYPLVGRKVPSLNEPAYSPDPDTKFAILVFAPPSATVSRIFPDSKEGYQDVHYRFVGATLTNMG